jgi:hypothetical protein
VGVAYGWLSGGVVNGVGRRREGVGLERVVGAALRANDRSGYAELSVCGGRAWGLRGYKSNAREMEMYKTGVCWKEKR